MLIGNFDFASIVFFSVFSFFQSTFLQTLIPTHPPTFLPQRHYMIYVGIHLPEFCWRVSINIGGLPSFRSPDQLFRLASILLQT
jgi:hypothetical protein